MPFDPSAVDPKPCAYCGRPFMPPAYVTKPGQWEKAKHCSISCGRKNGKARPRKPLPTGVSYAERFLGKVAPNASNGCWEWAGHRAPTGYGQVNRNGVTAYAHRVAYELAVGPIPDGLHLDHLCRNPPCVNPAHLEPVTVGENHRRGLWGVLRTHCFHGHEWVPENLMSNGEGKRCCKVCHREQGRARKRRKQEAARESRNAPQGDASLDAGNVQ